MKLLKTIGLSAAILLTSALSVVQTSSSANAKVLKNWMIEKEIFTPLPTFPKPKNEADCYGFVKFNGCYKGYKHFTIARHKQKKFPPQTGKVDFSHIY